ncbi:MAG: hypothetical protein QM698_08095 [Micropepsaceae bacterium]
MSTHDLTRVTLHLARAPGWPEGSARYGYDIIAPLRRGGRLDAALWRANRAACTVRRFRPDEDDRFGMLVHRAGGQGGATWLIDYNSEIEEDDERGFRFDRHNFGVGDHVTLTDGAESHAYKVVEIHPF